jgi:excisionase family DNA binding protein
MPNLARGGDVTSVPVSTTYTHPLAYRPKDACRMIGVGKTKLQGLINSGHLTAKKLGPKVTIIPHDQLEKLLAD